MVREIRQKCFKALKSRGFRTAEYCWMNKHEIHCGHRGQSHPSSSILKPPAELSQKKEMGFCKRNLLVILPTVSHCNSLQHPVFTKLKKKKKSLASYTSFLPRAFKVTIISHVLSFACPPSFLRSCLVAGASESEVGWSVTQEWDRLVFANFLKPSFPRVQKGNDHIYILESRKVSYWRQHPHVVLSSQVPFTLLLFIYF